MKDKLKNIDNKAFLLYMTIVLFIIMYGIGVIMFGNKGFQKPQVFLNLFKLHKHYTIIKKWRT